MKLTSYQFTRIATAASLEEAMRITGQFGDAHFVRVAFIQRVFGPRATGGFFTGTKSAVNLKFAKAFEQAQNAQIENLLNR